MLACFFLKVPDAEAEAEVDTNAASAGGCGGCVFMSIARDIQLDC